MIPFFWMGKIMLLTSPFTFYIIRRRHPLFPGVHPKSEMAALNGRVRQIDDFTA
jgi:hypothetical protein